MVATIVVSARPDFTILMTSALVRGFFCCAVSAGRMRKTKTTTLASLLTRASDTPMGSLPVEPIEPCCSERRGPERALPRPFVKVKRQYGRGCPRHTLLSDGFHRVAGFEAVS